MGRSKKITYYNNNGDVVIHNAKSYPEYSSWVSVRTRCYNKNSVEYIYYGAKGITMCERWRNSFFNFYQDMGEKPGNGYSLDRIDNTKGYSPDNCRWATIHEQAKNRRGTHPITFNGETLIISEWAEKTGIARVTIAGRLHRGWNIEKTLTTPVTSPSPLRKTTIKRDIPEYKVWWGIKGRCHNKNHMSYPKYGARGIFVCDRWINSFENFYDDMGKRPSNKYSIDRIDSTKGYSPDNCRWATDKEQSRNLKFNRYIEHNGEKLLLCEWAEKTGISSGTIASRIKRGWTITDSLTKKPIRFSSGATKAGVPVTYMGETLLLREWSKKTGLTYKVLRKRLDSGWSIEKAFTTPLQENMRRKKCK